LKRHHERVGCEAGRLEPELLQGGKKPPCGDVVNEVTRALGERSLGLTAGRATDELAQGLPAGRRGSLLEIALLLGDPNLDPGST
jgi:hypothetical protein